MFNQIPVAIVAAIVANTRAIGRDNGLLWHIPDDMKRFKELTVGKPIIMGRKTFESIIAIIGKPLPGRTNIVVTRSTEFFYPGAITALNLETALEIAAAEKTTEIHIGGGEEIYKQALSYVDRLYLTLIQNDKIGDAFFPPFENEFTPSVRHGSRTYEELSYEWVDYVRKVPLNRSEV